MKMKKILGFLGGSNAHKEAATKKDLQERRKAGYGTLAEMNAPSTLADRVRESLAMKRKLRTAFGQSGMLADMASVEEIRRQLHPASGNATE